LRRERHNESLDRARRLEMAADMISTHAPKPPRALSAQRVRGSAEAGSYRVAPLMVGGEARGPSETGQRSYQGAKKKKRRSD
jgi:hypothetical protein